MIFPRALHVRPAACPRLQRGSALILALVAVFIATSISAALIASLGRSIDMASALQDQRQARLLARGAVDWARNVLAADARRTGNDNSQEPWTVEIPPIPVGDSDEGEVSGQIKELSGLFNLNQLAPQGEPNPVAVQQYARLLTAIGVPQGQANQLTTALQHAILPLPENAADDALPHSPLVDPLELAQVPGYEDPALRARILPFVTAVPAPSKVNLNFAPPEVLSALTEGLTVDAARQLAAERDRAWFRTVAEYASRLPAGARLTSVAACDVRSRYFLVTGRARSGAATVSLETLLERTENWPTILWQKLL